MDGILDPEQSKYLAEEIDLLWHCLTIQFLDQRLDGHVSHGV
jgi:hypothetical protein